MQLMSPIVLQDVNAQQNFYLLACSLPKLLHQNFKPYSGINGAIKSCIYKALSHSVPECQMPEQRKCGVWQKSVAMVTSLEISEKDVQIDHRHSKRFYLVHPVCVANGWVKG